jgi:hypothetical protein
LNIPGLYIGDAAQLAGEIGESLETVQAGLDALVAAGHVEVDADHFLIVVAWTDAYVDDGPANPSVAKGWLKTFKNAIACLVRDRHRDRLIALFPDFAKVAAREGVDTVSPQGVETVSPHRVDTVSPQGVETLPPFSNSNSNSNSKQQQQEIPALAGEKKLSRPKSQKPRREDPEASDLIAFWVDEWKRLFLPNGGTSPTIDGPSKARAKALVEENGFEEAKQLVARYLTERAPFLSANGHALQYLTVARVNGYRATVNGSHRGPAPPGDFAGMTPGRQELT